MKDEAKETRAHEHVLDIDARPEDVWKAITTPEELVRWFPMEAEVRPGKGGEIVCKWGELAGRCRILEWDPPRHLKTGWMEAPEPGGGAHGTPAGSPAPPVCVDWFLEGRGGGTRLRVVHSGFGRGAQWDKEFDGTNRGWTFELQALKHYLERQRGKERRAFWVRRPTALAREAVWERFRKPGGVFRSVALDALGSGDRFRLERPDGEVLEGRVLVNAAPLEFAGTLESLGGGMIRFGFEDCMGGPEAHVWIATWGLPASEVAALERRWNAALEQAFG